MISANFLVPTLLNYAELPMTPFQNYQMQFIDTVCAINACGSVTSDGRYYLKDDSMPDDVKSKIDEYMYVQYLDMFGVNESNEQLFMLK